MTGQGMSVKLTPAQQETVLEMVMLYGQERADHDLVHAEATFDRICKLVYGIKS